MPLVYTSPIQASQISYASYEFDFDNQLLDFVWQNNYVTGTYVTANSMDINTVDYTNCTIQMQDETFTSIGTSFFLTNKGNEDLRVLKSNGVQIVLIPAQETFFIQVINNDPANIKYKAIQFSGVVPFVNNIAGYGLKADPVDDDKIDSICSIQNLTANYTIAQSDLASCLRVLPSNTDIINVNLDNSVLNVSTNGFYFKIANYGQSNVILNALDSKTINNEANFVIQPTQTCDVICDASQNWWTVGLGLGSTANQQVGNINLYPYINAGLAYLNLGSTPNLTKTILQFYCDDGTNDVPLTADFNIYLGNTPSYWYINNLCSFNGGSVILNTGTNVASSSPITLNEDEIYNIALSLNPVTGVAKIQLVPTTVEINSAILGNGNVGEPSLQFEYGNSGLYSSADGHLNISSNGANIADFNYTNTTFLSACTFSEVTNFSALGTFNTLDCTNDLNIGGNLDVTGALTALSLSATNVVCTNNNISGNFNAFDVGNNKTFNIDSNNIQIGLNSNEGNIVIGNTGGIGTSTLLNGTTTLNNTVNLNTNLNIANAKTFVPANTATGNLCFNELLTIAPINGNILYFNGISWVCLAPPADGTGAKTLQATNVGGTVTFAWV